jgi:hypothetical protein
MGGKRTLDLTQQIMPTVGRHEAELRAERERRAAVLASLESQSSSVRCANSPTRKPAATEEKNGQPIAVTH